VRHGAAASLVKAPSVFGYETILEIRNQTAECQLRPLPSSPRGDLDESAMFSIITLTVALATMLVHVLPIFRIPLNEDIKFAGIDQSLETRLDCMKKSREVNAMT